jgi:hypothetical protein
MYFERMSRKYITGKAGRDLIVMAQGDSDAEGQASFAEKANSLIG